MSILRHVVHKKIVKELLILYNKRILSTDVCFLTKKGTMSYDTTGASSSATSSGLSLPTTNHELKRLEEAVLLGQDLILRMALPNGETIEMRVKESNEVGYVKLLLAEKCGFNAGKIQLYFNNKQLIDPMSLCDHQGVKPPAIDVEVKVLNP